MYKGSMLNFLAVQMEPYPTDRSLETVGNSTLLGQSYRFFWIWHIWLIWVISGLSIASWSVMRLLTCGCVPIVCYQLQAAVGYHRAFPMKMWHIASLVYVSEGMYEYLYAFWGASSQGNQECISFALAAYYTPKKGSNNYYSLLLVIYVHIQMMYNKNVCKNRP